MTSERGTEQLAKYLTEARAIERGLTRTLQSHIAMTPSGTYRHGLERHQTRSHAKRIERRVKEIGHGRTLPQLGADVMQSLLAQATALSKLPLDLMRGDGGEEKLLANVRDEAASEASEIALYDTIEALARELGDNKTAELAASVRADEERALLELRDAIPELANILLRARVEGISTYDPSHMGAARDVRRAANSARKAASWAADDVRGAARQARKVPGVARAGGAIKGAVASEQDLAITGYDDLSADEITAKLPERGRRRCATTSVATSSARACWTRSSASSPASKRQGRRRRAHAVAGRPAKSHPYAPDADPARRGTLMLIGSGLIIARGDAVRGLTTAAGVWATAAVGMAVGGDLPLWPPPPPASTWWSPTGTP